MKRFLSERIEALPLRFCSHRQLLMEFRRDPQIELAGELPARLNALLLAHPKEHIERLLELPAQLVRIRPIEIGATAEPENLTAKEIRVGVVLNPGLVAVNRHQVHGLTPCSSSQLRIEATAPLSVSGDG